MNRRSRSDNLSRRHPERIEFAREQRQQANQFATDVWQLLRASRLFGRKFRREHPIPPYTVDLVCIDLKLIVEIDGKHHQSDEGKLRDKNRDQFLRQAGYEIVRINGFAMTQDQAIVRKQIEDAIDKCARSWRSPSPPAREVVQGVVFPTLTASNANQSRGTTFACERHAGERPAN